MAMTRTRSLDRRFDAPISRSFILLGLSILFMASSCTLIDSKPVRLNIEARHYEGKSPVPVKRVLVLPFYNETEYQDQGSLLDEVFSQALVERGRFEVVPLPQQDAEMIALIQPYTTGRVPMEVLMELGTWYRADAVLMGCLKRYDPYTRPKIGLKADIISVYNGSVLSTVNGLLDSGEDNVARDMVQYFEDHHHYSHEQSLSEWRTMLASPRMYARYACHRFVDALYPLVEPKDI